MQQRVLITAGPTREYIDPVRYISNDSSGRMGFVLAEAADKMGARVTLISGPVQMFPPHPTLFPLGRGKRVRGRYIKVVSAQEMFRAVKKHYKTADIIIMAAAVADFRPARYSRQKIKKDEGRRTKDESSLVHRPSSIVSKHISLVRTPDILEWLGRHKRPHQLLVGFALETENLIKNARKKLKEKNCDIIVANYAGAIGKKMSSAVIIHRNGTIKKLGRKSKLDLAKKIFTTFLP